MLSGLLRLLAAALALAGLGLVVPAPALARDADTDTTPLAVTIEHLTPSYVPSKGRVTVSGSVTNDDAVPWLDVNVYPFIGRSPITSQSELATAVASDPDTDVGDRITKTGDYETFASIAPGETVAFTIQISRKDLRSEGVTEQGVYWFGVHAYGSGPTGRVTGGRARTFLPLVSRTSGSESASVVMPIRNRVIRKPDGSLDRVEEWSSLLGPDGRLGRLADIGATAAHRLSWLVDPAVLDAIQQLASGDKPRNLGPTGSGQPQPSASPAALVVSAETLKTAEQRAKAWLGLMLPILRNGTVLALPYGDLDLGAAAEHGSSNYQLALDRAAAAFKAFAIHAVNYTAPLDGLIDTGGLGLTDPATPALVSDQALPSDPSDPDSPVPTRVDADGWHLIATSSAAASGGPQPGDTASGIAMRQRVLAEAAVRLLQTDRPPLVVSLPAHWAAEDADDFASGLDAPWLALSAPLEATYGTAATSIGRENLAYPTSEVDAQVNGRAFDETDRLIKDGRMLQAVLARNDQVAGDITDEALTSLGYPARGGRGGAAAETSRAWVEDRLDQIQLQTPPSLTLSGNSGRFPVTIVNGLSQPITVGLQAEADPGVHVRVQRSIQVGPHGHNQVLLNARSKTVGIHNVTLHLVDPRGVELPGHASFPVRSAQVSNIIWAFLTVGGALLFGAIGMRVVRRMRSHGG